MSGEVASGGDSDAIARHIEARARWARLEYENIQAKISGNSSKKKFKVSVMKASWLRRLLIWNGHMKSIEQKYGGGFLSLFEFIRWLVLVNLVICALLLVFVLLPQFVYNLDVTQRNLGSNSSLSVDASAYCANQTNSTNDTNASFSVVLTDYQSGIVATKCCSLAYQSAVKQKINQDPGITDAFLDLLQGTGKLEDSFLFYGYYSNRSSKSIFSDVEDMDETTEMPDKHIYYMGLSFAFISMASLLIMAVSMLLKLGSGIRKKIVNKMDTVSSSKYFMIVFCTWDFKLRDKKIIQYQKSSIGRFLKTNIKQMVANMNKRRLSRSQKLWRFVKHSAITLFIVAMFPAAGYGFYKLNQFSQEFIKTNSKDIQDNEYGNYIITGLQYIPTVSLKVIVFIFTFIFYRIQSLEDYSKSTRFTLLLVRLGFARIGSLFFLVITIAINLLRSPSECGFQKIDLEKLAGFNLSSFNIDFIDKSKDEILCYETYIGQEFYKLVVLDVLVQLGLFLFKFFLWLIAAGCSRDSLKMTFNLEETFLDLLYIQTAFWLSIYFSPFLGMFACVYFVIKFYLTLITLRVLTNLPTDKPQIESKINNSFFFVLFIVFILVLLIYGIVFSALRPSLSCGPFRFQTNHNNYGDFTIVGELTNLIQRKFPPGLFRLVDVVLSNMFLWTLTFVLMLIVWLMFTYARTYRELSDELRKLVEAEHRKNEVMAKGVKYLERKVALHAAKPASN